MSQLEKGAIAKRETHEVGKAYLRAWIDNTLPNNRIWHFDLKTQKIEPRSNKATFAIDNYLYVPRIGKERDDSTENWLSLSENSLTHFIKRIDTHTFKKPISTQELVKVMFGLISLSYRSGYEIRALEQQLKTDQKLREMMGIADICEEFEIHKMVVENMVMTIPPKTGPLETKLSLG